MIKLGTKEKAAILMPMGFLGIAACSTTRQATESDYAIGAPPPMVYAEDVMAGKDFKVGKSAEPISRAVPSNQAVGQR